MAKKIKNPPTRKQADENTNLYKLKTDAVDRLVNAEKKEYPKLTIGKDPGRVYKAGFLDRIPSWIKALFIKFWFNGAVCFFIFWGLGIFIPNMENMIIILAISMGMVTDVLVNNAFRFFATVEGANDKWMMFPKKKYINLIFNIIYSFAVLLIVVWFYNTLNGVINVMLGTENQVYVGVEPVLFGLFYVIFDLCFIGMKNLCISIVRDAKNKNGV